MTRRDPVTSQRYEMLVEQWHGRYNLHYFRDPDHARAWIAATRNPRMVEPSVARGRLRYIADHLAEDVPELQPPPEPIAWHVGREIQSKKGT